MSLLLRVRSIRKLSSLLLSPYTPLLLKFKVILRVIVADILHHLTYAVVLVARERNHAVLDVVAQHIAQRATEILVTRITQERTTVGQHAPSF